MKRANLPLVDYVTKSTLKVKFSVNSPPLFGVILQQDINFAILCAVKTVGAGQN